MHLWNYVNLTGSVYLLFIKPGLIGNPTCAVNRFLTLTRIVIKFITRTLDFRLRMQDVNTLGIQVYKFFVDVHIV